MRLNPFKRKDEQGETIIRRGKYKKKTFASVADQILIKKMKSDPSFGLEMAKKYRGVDENKGEPQSIKRLLKEQVELKELIQELTDSKASAQANWWQSILTNVVDKTTLNNLLKALIAVKVPPEAMRAMGIEVEQTPIAQPIVQRIEQPDEQPVTKTVTDNKVSFKDFVDIMNFEPKEAIVALNELNPDWVTIIASKDYDSLVKELKKIKLPSEFEEYRQQLMGETRVEWLKGLISEAKTLGNER